MKNNTGYKQMLRDRTPKVVDFALKWCKCKEAWLEHVYKNYIWIYSSNEERNKVTRQLLGLNKNPHVFNFADTIQKDNLSDEEKTYWEDVEKWVSWFQKQYAYIENAYCTSKTVGKDIVEIKLEIISTYLRSMCPTKEDDTETRNRKNDNVNRLTDFLIDCFENRI